MYPLSCPSGVEINIKKNVVHSWTSGKVRSVASYLEASLVRGGSQTVGLAAPQEILTTNSSQDQDTQLSRGADVL